MRLMKLLQLKTRRIAIKELEAENEDLKEKLKNCSAKNEEEEAKRKKKKRKKRLKTPKKKKEDKEDATLENAMPTQELVKAVGTAINIDFGSKTPSFKSLAGMLGIKEDDPALRIAAVNAKFNELVSGKKAEAKNTRICGGVLMPGLTLGIGETNPKKGAVQYDGRRIDGVPFVIPSTSEITSAPVGSVVTLQEFASIGQKIVLGANPYTDGSGNTYSILAIGFLEAASQASATIDQTVGELYYR